jgi:septum formation inhibitor MinC
MVITAGSVAVLGRLNGVAESGYETLSESRTALSKIWRDHSVVSL